MASLLVNDRNDSVATRPRLLIDEAVMNHFGALVRVIRLANAEEAVLLGDRNQLPFIDRLNLFKLKYARPNSVMKVTEELLCTYRNLMDVAYTLSEGI